MKELLLCLLACSLGGACAGMVILLLKHWLRDKLSPAWHCYVWLAMMILLLLPVSVKLPEASASPAPTISQTVPLEVAQEPLEKTEKPAVPPVQNIKPAENSQPQREKFQFPHWGWTALVTIWLLGVMIFLGRKWKDYRSFRKGLENHSYQPDEKTLALLRQAEAQIGILHPLELKISSLPVPPMLVGIFKPTLFLPEEALNQHQLSLIFIHELTHYHYGDLFYKGVALLLQGLHWFNPLCVCMAEDIDFSCELCCDQRVRRSIGAERSKEYGSLLLELVALDSNPSQFSTAFSLDKASLKRRLTLIMKPKQTSRLLALLLTASLTLCGAACSRTVAPELYLPVIKSKSTATATREEEYDHVSETDTQYQGGTNFAWVSADTYLQDDTDTQLREWLEQAMADGEKTYALKSESEYKGLKRVRYLLYCPVAAEKPIYDTNVDYGLLENRLTLNLDGGEGESGKMLCLITHDEDASSYYKGELQVYDKGQKVDYDLKEVDFDLSLLPKNEENAPDNGLEKVVELSWPLPQDAAFTVSALFGGEPLHKGVDLAAEKGTEILAAADATVTFADWYSGFGYTVLLDHGQGLLTQYAHCEELLVKEGDQVSAGQPIATMGSSGSATGILLHFQVQKDGIAVDPADYMSKLVTEDDKLVETASITINEDKIAVQ